MNRRRRVGIDAWLAWLIPGHGTVKFSERILRTGAFLGARVAVLEAGSMKRPEAGCTDPPRRRLLVRRKVTRDFFSGRGGPPRFHGWRDFLPAIGLVDVFVFACRVRSCPMAMPRRACRGDRPANFFASPVLGPSGSDGGFRVMVGVGVGVGVGLSGPGGAVGSMPHDGTVGGLCLASRGWRGSTLPDGACRGLWCDVTAASEILYAWMSCAVCRAGTGDGSSGPRRGLRFPQHMGVEGCPHSWLSRRRLRA